MHILVHVLELYFTLSKIAEAPKKKHFCWLSCFCKPQISAVCAVIKKVESIFFYVSMWEWSELLNDTEQINCCLLTEVQGQINKTIVLWYLLHLFRPQVNNFRSDICVSISLNYKYSRLLPQGFSWCVFSQTTGPLTTSLGHTSFLSFLFIKKTICHDLCKHGLMKCISGSEFTSYAYLNKVPADLQGKQFWQQQIRMC